MKISDRFILNRLEAITEALKSDPLIFEYINADGNAEELTIEQIIEREEKHKTGASIFKIVSGNNINDLRKMLQYTRRTAAAAVNEYYARGRDPTEG